MEQKDHDLLIKLDTNMTTMCKKMEKFHDENRQDHKDILKLMESKVDFKWFKWLVGSVAAFMIVFGTWQTNHITKSTLEYNSLHYAVQHLIDDSPHEINLNNKN